jgi:predicted enzyme related to lactoylglutathione lyase
MSNSSVSKLANVIIPVADQDRAVEFYIEKLGLEKRVELPCGPDFRWIEVAPAEADTAIALCPPGPGVTPGGKQTGISLQTDDVDAYHAELKARGVDVDAEVGRFGDASRRRFGSATTKATSCRSSRVNDRCPPTRSPGSAIALADRYIATTPTPNGSGSEVGPIRTPKDCCGEMRKSSLWHAVTAPGTKQDFDRHGWTSPANRRMRVSEPCSQKVPRSRRRGGVEGFALSLAQETADEEHASVTSRARISVR